MPTLSDADRPCPTGNGPAPPDLLVPELPGRQRVRSHGPSHRCVSSSSHDRASRSSWRSSGRSRRSSSGSGSPASAGVRPGPVTTGCCTPTAICAPSATTRPSTTSAGSRRRRRWSTCGGRRSCPRSTVPGHAAFRRPGRAVRVQPQRRPARLPRAARDVPGAGPDPRPGRHRSRRALARGRLG